MTREDVYELINQHYRKHAKRLVKSFSKHVESRQNAEDIVQTAYMRACEYWDSFEVDRRFDMWFISILMNCVKDKFNEERHHGMVDEPIGHNDIFKAPQAINRLILQDIATKIDEQKLNVRKILKLFFFLQYTDVDIVKLVPESLSNIQKITSRFRQTMKNA